MCCRVKGGIAWAETRLNMESQSSLRAARHPWGSVRRAASQSRGRLTGFPARRSSALVRSATYGTHGLAAFVPLSVAFHGLPPFLPSRHRLSLSRSRSRVACLRFAGSLSTLLSTTFPNGSCLRKLPARAARGRALPKSETRAANQRLRPTPASARCLPPACAPRRQSHAACPSAAHTAFPPTPAPARLARACSADRR